MSQGGKKNIYLLITESFDQLHCSSDLLQDKPYYHHQQQQQLARTKQLCKTKLWLKPRSLAYDEHLF
jgi:hypothetical protein